MMLKRKPKLKNLYTVKYIGDGSGFRDKGIFYSQVKGTKYRVKTEKTIDNIKLISLQGFGGIFFIKEFYIKCKGE